MRVERLRTLGRVLVGAALLAGFASACTFEPRPEELLQQEDEAEGPEFSPPVLLVEDSVRAVRSAFQEAMEAGNLSGALSLLDRDAVLVDRLGPLEPSEVSRGELLLEVLGRYSDGLTLEPVGSELMVIGGQNALLVTRYEMWEGLDGDRERTGSLLETLVVVRGQEGWRIQHLHRSLGDDDRADTSDG